MVFPDRDADAEAWSQRLETPWGRLQASLLRRRLLSWLEDDRLESVLDIGCGLGDLAAALAPYTARLTCVDRSKAMLAAAKQRVSSATATVDFECRDLDDGLTDLGVHDLVVAHNVIDYSSDPRRAVSQVAAQVRPGGRLSVSFGNGTALALRHAVMTQDFAEALRLAQLRDIRLPAPCGESARLRRSDVEAWLEDAGVSVTHRAGVRVLVDLLPNEIKSHENMLVIEELELQLGDRSELIDVGAVVHLVAARL